MFYDRHKGHKLALVPNWLRPPVRRSVTGLLLRLERLDVTSKVGHPLLHLTLLSTA